MHQPFFSDDELVPANIDFNDEVDMISNGNGMDSPVTLKEHFLIDADGTVKVDFRQESTKRTG